MPARYPAEQKKSESRLLSEGQGFKGESFGREVATATAALVSGRAYFSMAPFLADDVITNIICQVEAGGTSLTLVKVGVYSLAGTQLATSTDNKANFTSTGVVVSTALSTPYTVTSSSSLFLEILTIGTTPPTLIQRPSGVGIRSVGSGIAKFGIQSSLSDQPSLPQ